MPKIVVIGQNKVIPENVLTFFSETQCSQHSQSLPQWI